MANTSSFTRANKSQCDNRNWKFNVNILRYWMWYKTIFKYAAKTPFIRFNTCAYNMCTSVLLMSIHVKCKSIMIYCPFRHYIHFCILGVVWIAAHSTYISYIFLLNIYTPVLSGDCLAEPEKWQHTWMRFMELYGFLYSNTTFKSHFFC